MKFIFKLICKKDLAFFLLSVVITISAAGQETIESKAELDSLARLCDGAKTALQKVKAISPLLKYYRQLAKFDKADSLLKSGLSIAEKEDDKLAIVYAHMNYITTTYNLSENRRTEMLQHMETGLKLAKEGNYKTEELLILSNFGFYYSVRNINTEKAAEYFNKAELDDEAITDSARSIFYYHKSAYYAMIKDDINKFKCGMKSLKYAEKSKSHYTIIRSYRILSYFYKDIGEYDKAMKWFEKEKAAVIENGNKKDLINVNYVIGVCYKEWGKADKAIEQFKTVLDGSVALNDQFNRNMAASDLCFLYLKEGNIAEAKRINEKYHNLQLNLERGNMIGYYYDMGNYNYWFNIDSSIYYYNKGILLADSSTDIRAKYFLYIQAAKAYHQKGNAPKSIELLKKALAVNSQLKLLANYTYVYNEMDSAYLKLGDYKNAYESRRLFNVFQDSLDKINDKKEILQAEINAEEETQKNLEEEELNATAKKHNIQYTAITIGGLILIISLLSLSFFHTPKWLVRVLGFVSFIFLFEFLILILDTKIHHWAHGAPLPILLIKIAIACLLVPLHHWLEHKVIGFLHSKKIKVTAVIKEKVTN
jgi:tetratricopeptide (TPR) repeat protein